MKTILIPSYLVLALQAQAADAPAKAKRADGESAPYAVKERGPHHRVWERVEYETRPNGQKIPRVHSYTELATGMHYKDTKGKWVESKEEIQILPNGTGASASQGQHKVIFPPNLYDGMIELNTPDNKWLRSRVLGLSYFDSATGQSVLIAETKDTVGELLGSNVVVYPDAFTDLRADVRCTYTKGGFEQDIILREQPPSPTEYGLNPETTRLQVLTEFFEPPVPEKRKHKVKEIQDETLDFGQMKIGQGKAFALGDESSRQRQERVSKSWEKLDGRDFLIEELQFKKVESKLRELPRTSVAVSRKRTPSNSALHRVVSKRVLPDRRLARQNTNTFQLAKASMTSKPGYVLDYVILNADLNNYTFLSDTTYSVTAFVRLSGGITFEPGTVIKFGGDADLEIISNDDEGTNMNWLTTSYRPAIFTSKNDNSVGEIISGSSGNPQAGDYFSAIIGDGQIRNARFSYAGTAVSFIVGNAPLSIWNCQFVNCANAIQSCDMDLHNVLFSQVGPVEVAYGGNLFAEHLTMSESEGILISPTSQSAHFINCLFVNSGSGWSGTPPQLITDEVQVINNPQNPVFQTAGAGAHYLADNSDYRDVGSMNISGSLLAELKKKTTYPPLVRSDDVTITTPTIWQPSAPLDTEAPDLGYHYDPIDYLSSCSVSGTTLTLTNGVVVGLFKDNCIRLVNGGVVVSVGRADKQNLFVHCSRIQEQHEAWDPIDTVSPFLVDGIDGGAIDFRFTRLDLPPAIGYVDVYSYPFNLTFRDCEIYYLWMYNDYGFPSGDFRAENNLFQDCWLRYEVDGGLWFRNNLFKSCNSKIWGNDTGLPFRSTDNVFDGDYIEGPLVYSGEKNAYLNDVESPDLWSATDPIVIANFTWVKGPLGDYYQQTGSALINAGSSTAADAGLYHCTVKTSNLKEGDDANPPGTVDIGYHYVALDGNGNPVDTDGDGVPDYLEDSNGNGQHDPGSGESHWYKVATPVFSPAAGSFAVRRNVVITCATPGALIHYRYDDNDPTEFDDSISSGDSLQVTQSKTIRVKAFKSGLVPSDVNSASFTITGAIAAGRKHVLALKSDGTVLAAGSNGNGQCGDGTTDPNTNLETVPGLTDIAGVAAGQLFSLAWESDGTAWAWGGNANGQLGNETTSSTAQTTPISVHNLAGVVAMSGGNQHSLALLSDGTVKAWGLNSEGQLGDGTQTRRTSPVQVLNLNSVMAIAAGGTHSLALKSNGTVWAWGHGSDGQLGNGNNVDQATPVQVTATYMQNVKAIAAGLYHSLALTADGKVWAWGRNSRGQLGNTSTSPKYSPFPVAGLSGIVEVAIAAGGTNSLALRDDGTVWTWGDNTSGQLGNCNVVGYVASPVQVLGLSDVVSIAACRGHGVALKSDGTIATWGYLNYGEEVNYDCNAIIPEPEVRLIDDVANLPPTITVSPPDGSTFLASDTIEILVEATDSDGTIAQIQLFQGVNQVATTASSILRYSLEDVPAGTYTFTAKARDDEGTATVSSPVTITINDSGPVVSLQGTQPFFTSSPGTLVATVVGVNPGALTSLTLNGVSVTPQTGVFTLTASLTEGENTFTLVATDNQSRTEDATTKVYLDSVSPTISIAAPADNSSFNTDRINVSGTFTETSLKQITINGVLAFISGGSFEALNVPLTEGANTITATAQDIAGNVGSDSISVTGSSTPVDAVQLSASPVGGFAPLNVTFQAVNNAPGTFQQALYDFNGDNVTDQTVGNLNPITHNYTAAGEYFPVVTIQTSAGRFSSPGGWNSTTLDRLRINVQTPPQQVGGPITVTDPVDLKVTAGGNLYILSRSTATVYEYNAGGTLLRSLSGIGTTPTGLDVDGSGNVYVAINGHNQVAKYKPTTDSFELDGTFGNGGLIGRSDQSSGSGYAEFNSPFDVAVMPGGSGIVVSDSGNHRIQQFTTSGSFAGSFGQSGNGIGQFNNPKGLTYDSSAYLYIVDSGNNRIALALDSTVVGTSGTAGSALGQFSGAINLGVGSRGIYVADTGNNRVQAFDPPRSVKGLSPTPFTARLALSTGFSPNLAQPTAVAPIADFLAEKIYIADTGNNRVLKVTLPETSSPVDAWTAMKTSLVNNGDIDGAVSQFSVATADSYREAFLSIGISKASDDINAAGTLTPVFISGDAAQYYFNKTLDAQSVLFPVEFVKENGKWKISGF